MTWQPGQPVQSEPDHREWEAWRRERKRQQQRVRRAQYPRIDYYPSPEAAEVIEAQWAHRVGCDLSSIINRMVQEWAAGCHRNKVRGSGGGSGL